MNLQALVRPSILALTAYSSARSLASQGSIFLDANECPTGTLNRYPAPQPKALLENFSRIYQVAPENILMGRGSDEAIDLLTRSLCEPGKDAILITPPTYGMYKVSADIQNIETLCAPLAQKENSWRLDMPAIKNKITEKVKIIYLCSPNNPTGTAFPLQDVREICQRAAATSLVVLDEAYGEFSETQSGTSLLSEFKNLVVLRTLSKSWGLAGLRCGVLLGHTDLIAILQKVRAPYPLPQPVIDIAVEATNVQGEQNMREQVKMILLEKTRLQKALEQLPQVVKVYESQGNFLLVEFKDQKVAMALTASNGIVLRSRHSEIPGCIRITVGAPKENDQLIFSLSAKDSL